MELNAALPNDLTAAHALIAKLTAEAADRDLQTARIAAERDAAIARAAEDSDENAALRDEVKRLTEILATFQRHRFGKRTEALDPDQLALFLEDVEIALGAANAALDAAIDRRDPSAKAKRRKNLGHLPAHLERIERVIDIEDKTCACCGGDLHVIDEHVSERLDVVPVQFRVAVTRRPRYGCRGCDEAGVVQAPSPDHIIDGGLPTEALLAWIAVGKYADHSPVHRQLAIFARQGVRLDRSTVCDWMGRVAWWMRPLHGHLMAHLRSSTKLFADETIMPVLAPGQVARGQLWAYARDDRPWGGGDPPAVAYVYEPDRRQQRPLEHLAGFAGVLQVDGYSGYNKLGRGNAVSLAYCWAHARRGFVEFRGKDPLADEALRRIAAIYHIDGMVRGRSPAERVAVRQETIRPMLAELRTLLQQHRRRYSAKSNMTKAISYILDRWEGLTRFIDDGRIELDSNIVERALKSQVITRKNALFAGSPEGARTWAVIGSFMETCRMNDVDPLAWLTVTLEKLAAGHSNKNLDALMPWNFSKTAA